MRILLFSGFLGSGKTTLILALARRLSELDLPVCVIVNEVGEIGIDGEVLADGGLEVYELCAGCICCQIGIDLVQTLTEVRARYTPSLVIVEASGVATPGGVLEALRLIEDPALSVSCVSMVDPTRLEALLEVVQPLMESQIAGADEIVISKRDACTDAEASLARATAARLAPAAAVWEVSSTDSASMAAFVESHVPRDRVAMSSERDRRD